MSHIDVLHEHGIRLRSYEPGKSRVPCPQCRKGKHDTALEVRLYEHAAFWNCYRCQWEGKATDHNASTIPPHVIERERAARDQRRRQEEADKAEKAQRIVARGRPARGTIVEKYLAGRGLALPEPGYLFDEHALLFVPDVYHWPSEQRLPAMVAPITNIMTREVQAVHLTFLAPGGAGKAAVDRPRLYQGPKAGGVVRLTPDAEVTNGLAIGEGIETCLVALLCSYPTWACLDAGNVGDMPVLEGVETLNVLADHDPAGLAAAERVAARWRGSGREVRRLTPPTAGTDWNDVAGAA